MLSCKNVPCQHWSHCPGGGVVTSGHYTLDCMQIIQILCNLCSSCQQSRYADKLSDMEAMFNKLSTLHIHTWKPILLLTVREIFLSYMLILSCMLLSICACVQELSVLSPHPHTTNYKTMLKWRIWRVNVNVLSNIASRSGRSIVSIQPTLAGED